MKIRGWSILLAFATIAGSPVVQAAPDFCRDLRAFVKSVQPDEKREFTFRTSWLSNFKDDKDPVLYAKRCEYGDYSPAQKVCDYLMEHGAIEFADRDVKDAVSCLSKGTRFDRQLHLYDSRISFRYGSENRGALIDITYKPDPVIGGMAFHLVADGF